MKRFALTVLVTVTGAFTSTAFASPFRAGAATANITPPLGIEINGGTAPVIATHVHDELHARALVVDDGSTRLAFVLVDACLIDRAVFVLSVQHADGRPLSLLANHSLHYEYPDRLSLPLQVFRIGQLAVAQWPGEIFAISGLDLKQRSPVKPLFNISMANGWYGYIPPPEQHAAGSYETWRGRTSPMTTNKIPQITAAFLNLLGQSKCNGSLKTGGTRKASTVLPAAVTFPACKPLPVLR